MNFCHQNVVTVGRVPEKANVVIPVATGIPQLPCLTL